MRVFVSNLLLALLWAALSNELTLFNLFSGFIVGFAALFVARGALGDTRYFRSVWLLMTFIGFFVRELVRSSAKVAHDIVTPQHRMRPGVIALEMDAKTDLEITLLANLISLTPGTLSLDVSADRTKLYIHAMYIDDCDAEAFKRRLKATVEKRVLELLE